MYMLQALLKNKLFYIVLAITLIVNSAINFNKRYNQDLLDDYYQSSGVAAGFEYEDRDENALRDNLVDYARLFLGKPYEYAGKGPDVFDCSGYTSYIFKKFNIKLPASSALQAGYGAATKTEDVKKGDLLVFKGPYTDQVGHVGMVISNENGKINFIHSSTSRGVIIDSLSHPHYQDRYLGARNVFGNR